MQTKAHIFYISIYVCYYQEKKVIQSIVSDSEI